MKTGWSEGVEFVARCIVWVSGLLFALFAVLALMPILPSNTSIKLILFLFLFFIASLVAWIFDLSRWYPSRRKQANALTRRRNYLDMMAILRILLTKSIIVQTFSLVLLVLEATSVDPLLSTGGWAALATINAADIGVVATLAVRIGRKKTGDDSLG